MTAFFCLLTMQIALGALDNLWHHELTERLPAKPSARGELALHTARELIYAGLFVGIAWWEWHGAWAWALVGLLAIEFGVTLWDFVIEDRTRRLPPLERVLHTILAVNLGAMLATWTPELLRWADAPTGLAAADHGLWAWFLTASSLGVLAWGLRDLAAVIRLGVPDWQRRPIEPGHVSDPRHVLVTGATGFVGRALIRALVTRGDRVTVLTRDPALARWRFGPHVAVVGNLTALDAATHLDAIVNLAGEPLAGGLWTAARKRRFVESRVSVTQSVLDLIDRLEVKPAVLVNASAIGIYGDRGEERLTETSAPASGFTSTLCRRWEAAALSARARDVRVCCLRIGLVLGADGGALAPLALATRLGVGAVMGGGGQWVSWIHRTDLVRLILHAIETPRLKGPVNAVAPTPVTQAALMTALGAALGRRIRLRLPAALLRRTLGGLSELFLASQRVYPTAAVFGGFAFAHPRLESALADLFHTPGAAAADGAPTVFVNEACGVCRAEIGHYAKVAAGSACGLSVQPVGAAPDALAACGLSEADIRRRLYVRDARGVLRSGLDAFVAIWETLPRYRRLAAWLRRPLPHALGALVYEGGAVPLLGLWNRRATRGLEPVPRLRQDGSHG